MGGTTYHASRDSSDVQPDEARPYNDQAFWDYRARLAEYRGELARRPLQQANNAMAVQMNAAAKPGYNPYTATSLFTSDDFLTIAGIPGVPVRTQRRIGSMLVVPRGTLTVPDRTSPSLWSRLTAALRACRWWWWVHVEAGATYTTRVRAGIERHRQHAGHL